MRLVTLTAAALIAAPLLALPAAAQDDGTRLRDGLDLLGEGTRMLLEGLAQDLGPALEGLRDRLGEFDAYEPPMVLPNGDIIIRRKVPPGDPLPDVDGEVEL